MDTNFQCSKDSIELFFILLVFSIFIFWIRVNQVLHIQSNMIVHNILSFERIKIAYLIVKSITELVCTIF